MKLSSHLRYISKAPTAAQTNFAIKLQGTLDIVDTLLLSQRQARWKAFFPEGGAEGESPDTGGNGGGGGFGGIGGGGDQ